jgi:hypothetical protein
MTALTRYARLESPGLWRADDGAQRRNVFVAFGESSLIVSDLSGRPVSHWSLPAISRVNPGHLPALFAPDTGGESLEIGEPEMIDAIEAVRRAIRRARPREGRLRLAGLAATLALVGGLATVWLPGALVQHTVAAVPSAQKAEIGRALLAHLERLTGPSCASPLGSRALGVLEARLMGPGRSGRLAVVPSAALSARALPGGLVMISAPIVEDYDNPVVAAGHVLAARVRSRHEWTRCERCWRQAALRMTLRILTNGNLPDSVLAPQAR